MFSLASLSQSFMLRIVDLTSLQSG